MSNHQKISSFIWSVCDELRGLFKPHEYGDVILPFVVLRRLDCVVEPDQSNFQLPNVKSENLKKKFINHIKEYPKNVHDIFFGFQFEETLEKLVTNNTLLPIIEKFSQIDLRQNIVDDDTMGLIFENLLNRLSDSMDESGGMNYTPRDVVQLTISLILLGEGNLKEESLVKSIYDPCCGTGGMLLLGQKYINDNDSSKPQLNLFGQEINFRSYSICKSYMLISGKDLNNIKLGSTLSNDQFREEKFDYMISHPPFTMNWESDKEVIQEEVKSNEGRFSVGTPRSSDSSLLFLQHLISKMKPKGSRIGIVFSGSPHLSRSSGGSRIRKWILENDWLECIVSLPDQLFHNTGISTYLWTLTNNKTPLRKGKVQLIDGSSMYKLSERSIGNKRKVITSNHLQILSQIYQDFDDSEYSKIHDNEFFGYTKVTIEQPLKEKNKTLLSKEGFPIPDPKKRDIEKIPLTENIEKFFKKEVKPFLPESWMDRKKDIVEYEINIRKVFSDIRHGVLKKSFPYSKWIRLKYIGSFVNKPTSKCLLIKEFKSQNNEDLVIPISNPIGYDQKKLKRYKIFEIKDSRIDPFTLSGYLNSRYGVNDILGTYLGSVIEKLNISSFQNLSIPILGEEITKLFNNNVELIDRIKNELRTIEQEVLYQFNLENSENINKKLYNILNSTNKLVKEDEIKSLIQKGENYFVEFKETFHSNVKNNYQKDEKMRYSGLKTICGFLNSKGGSLLVGVHDQQYVTGIEKDQFKDNDKYLLTIKDLIKSRLSDNSHMFLNYDIYKVDGKKILLVECEKSSEPVYLDGEHFFIRVNPSTEELKGTEMYNYLTKNFKNN